MKIDAVEEKKVMTVDQFKTLKVILCNRDALHHLAELIRLIVCLYINMIKAGCGSSRICCGAPTNVCAVLICNLCM